MGTKRALRTVDGFPADVVIKCDQCGRVSMYRMNTRHDTWYDRSLHSTSTPGWGEYHWCQGRAYPIIGEAAEPYYAAFDIGGLEAVQAMASPAQPVKPTPAGTWHWKGVPPGDARDCFALTDEGLWIPYEHGYYRAFSCRSDGYVPIALASPCPQSAPREQHRPIMDPCWIYGARCAKRLAMDVTCCRWGAANGRDFKKSYADGDLAAALGA